MGAPDSGIGVIDPVGIEPGLEDSTCRNAKPKDAPYKLSDGRGMYLLVRPNGAKYWRLKYRYNGIEKTYAIGVYPEISLAMARVERDRARQWLREGKDPTIERTVARARVSADQSLTFKAMAEGWYEEESPAWSEGHRKSQRSRLDNEILPHLGAFPIKELEQSPDRILAVLSGIHNRGAQEVVQKCKVIISQVFRYSLVPAGVKSDPVAMLRGRLKRTRPVEHRSKVGAEEMPALFKALGEVPSENITKLAIYWVILTAARTSEMRFATWSEIEKGKGGPIWRLSKERMKMDREHIVPLSKQAQEILTLAKPMRTSDAADALIFPGFTRAGSLSENALLALLARAGYFGRQTGHGFRASFSTWAHETAEANPDVIELCLAHAAGDIRGVYNDAKYLPQRRALLQQWADQCTEWGMKFPE